MTRLRLRVWTDGRELPIADVVDAIPDGAARRWLVVPGAADVGIEGFLEFNGSAAKLIESWARRRTHVSMERLLRTLRGQQFINGAILGIGPVDAIRIDAIDGTVYLVAGSEPLVQSIRAEFRFAELPADG